MIGNKNARALERKNFIGDMNFQFKQSRIFESNHKTLLDNLEGDNRYCNTGLRREQKILE